MVNKVTGAIIAVSATLPATYDSGGYAVPVFTTVGEVVDAGELALIWSILEHDPLAQSYPTKMKDSYNVQDVPLTIGYDSADAGQTILTTARDDTAAYAFKITMPSTNAYYFVAFVTKAGLAQVQKGNVEGRAVLLAVVPESIYEA